MTWGRYDDYAPFHRKWLTLSNDAVATMWRATTWARSRAADARPGFVTRKELRALSGGLSSKKFDRVLQELIEAGKPAHDFGLLDAVEGGFTIHNFERYGAPDQRKESRSSADETSAARAEAGRKSAEARKIKYGSAQPPGNVRNATEQNGGSTAEQARTNAPNKSPNKPEQKSAPGSGSDRKNKSSTTPPQDLSGSARVSADSVGGVRSDFSKFVSCSEELDLNSQQRTQLGAAGIPPWAVTALRRRFLATAMGNPSETRTLERWRQSLAAAICAMWNDPKQRPNPPEAFEKPGVANTRGTPTGYTDAAGNELYMD